MRSCYLVSYDISDPKRLRRVHRKMRGFGDPLQYSVFLCPLSPAERILLLEALAEIIHHREDQVMLINLGPVGGRVSESIETLGRAHDWSHEERSAVIV
jgi:CRISPR-associated protein Cas2